MGLGSWSSEARKTWLLLLCFLQVVQEFILGVYDTEATAAFNENHSDISTLKDPRSKDAAQRYILCL